LAEKDLYEPLIPILKAEFEDNEWEGYKFEITSEGVFSEEVEEKHPIVKEVKNKFDKQLRPDLIAWNDDEIIIIEVKDDPFLYEDLYQGRGYAEVLGQTKVFLLSDKNFNTDQQRFLMRRQDMLNYGGVKTFTGLIMLDNEMIKWNEYPY
tara:strand:- start:1014 stop:1463 length:450 start_codon:yes stop_codon:yes gene_type:complete